MAGKGAKKEAENNAVANKKEEKSLFAVIRVRGPVNIRQDIEETLRLMRLNRVNHCVLVPNDPSHLGMLHKAEEYITWGEINRQTLEKLLFKRGRDDGKGIEKSKAAELAKKIFAAGRLAKDLNLNPVFRLNTPSKGYKPIRRYYPKGALGYRGKEINTLLKRMV